MIVGGENYGQGSSREHAALAPRYLGVRAKLVKSFARIHKANLINFGILPLVFEDPGDYEQLRQGQTLLIRGIKKALEQGDEVVDIRLGGGATIKARMELSSRDRAILTKGGLLNWVKEQVKR